MVKSEAVAAEVRDALNLGTLAEAERLLEVSEAELLKTAEEATNVYTAHREGRCPDEYLFVAATAYFYAIAKRLSALARVEILQGRFDPSLIDETSSLM
ncbi:MAG: hypothetical protein ABW208_07220 [Pyrinomonadaceae bacterium]